MEKVHYDMIYLAACGINGIRPDREVLGEIDAEKLYRTSHTHFLDALVGTELKKAGIPLPSGWNEQISKAVRKVILLDAERAKLLSFMERKGIWYLPLKGIILKDYYPAIGMRQMSDNDILFDDNFSDEVQAYMESEGYDAAHVGLSNHDVYEKKPVYNFELHRALYSETYRKDWVDYYGNVKGRLVPDAGTSYGYQFTDEDFYVYITSHAYKHYAGSGTGLRTLLDFYAYLKAKERELDVAYIEKECEVLGMAEFEKQNRSLCKKVFAGAALKGAEALEQSLSGKEMEMLAYYLSSGVYGTEERKVENGVKDLKKKGYRSSKLRYMWNRLFPGYDTYRIYAPSVKGRFLQTVVGWFRRLFVVMFSKKRRSALAREIEIVKRVE